jgi:hypothetical protein
MWDMTKPAAFDLNQQRLHVLGVCDVMQVFVGYFVWPEYLHYLSQTGVLEAGESVVDSKAMKVAWSCST